ncbi:unnamed protein product [Orchesella dallaii]|uniref:Uncharacterized protein n=1 Tax=Orchesella dallaii TaxID=48710 RepID=A0ABP1Q6T4_9HEXA
MNHYFTMWKYGLVAILFLANFTFGQDQFLREVTNPSGPSQVLLSGGVLNRNVDPEDFQPQSAPEQNPDQQEEQAVPLQSNGGEQEIPQNGGDNNPFTNGENGFGLRLSQSPGAPQAQQPPPPATQPAQQQSPVAPPHPQQPQHHQGPVQQQPLTLPPLPPGHQYVDVYGRPIIFTQPETATPPPPQPSPTPVVQTQQTIPVQQQAFVDTYGRQIGGLQTGAQPQVLLTHAHAPVVHQEVIQPASVAVHPVAHKIVEHATLTLPLVQKKAPPPLTFHTYAVPAIHKVGNLAIPYAQKLVFAKPQGDIVFPPTISVPAVVKSKHKTVFSPVKLVQPVAPVVPVVKEVAAPPAVPVVHQLPSVVPQQILVQQPQQHFLVQQPQAALTHFQPPPHFHVAQPQVAVQQPLVQFYHPQPSYQYIHHGPPPQAVVPIAHHPPVHYVQKQLKQLVHVTSPVVPVAHPPVLLKKVKKIVPAVAKVVTKEVVSVPDFTLIHQPILSKVLFQKHIFNVKHGSEPLIYQDLCTVYPYQKNLRACVLKKATLPELHHPDIRTVNVQQVQQQQPQPDQSIITGGAAVIVPAPVTQPTPTVTVSRTPPKNIQDTIRRESAKSRQQAAEKAAAAAAAATTPITTTTAQPEAAESRTAPASKSSRRKKGSNPSPTTTEKPFKLA